MTTRNADGLYVRDLMTTDVFTLSATQSVTLADEVMATMRVRHIPVVTDDRRLVGLVTHRDLLSAKLSVALAASDADRGKWELQIPVSKIMQKIVWSVAPDTPALQAARILKEHSFGCLPVVQEGKLVGIVTEADFLRLITDTPALGDPAEPLTVSTAMTRAPRVLYAHDSIGEARTVMDLERMQHMPVVDAERRPIGVISERELRTAAAILGDPAKADALAIELLGLEEPYTVETDAPLGPVLLDMSARNVASALVVEEGKLVGLLTATEALRLLGQRLDPTGR